MISAFSTLCNKKKSYDLLRVYEFLGVNLHDEGGFKLFFHSPILFIFEGALKDRVAVYGFVEPWGRTMGTQVVISTPFSPRAWANPGKQFYKGAGSREFSGRGQDMPRLNLTASSSKTVLFSCGITSNSHNYYVISLTSPRFGIS